MAYIKTLKDNELIGGQDNTDVYPVSTTQAIFSQKPDGTIPEGIKHQRLEERLEDMESDASGLHKSSERFSVYLENDKAGQVLEIQPNVSHVFSLIGTAFMETFGDEPNIPVTPEEIEAKKISILSGSAILHEENAMSMDYTLPNAVGEYTAKLECTNDGITKSVENSAFLNLRKYFGFSEEVPVDITTLGASDFSNEVGCNIVIPPHGNGFKHIYFAVPTPMEIHRIVVADTMLAVLVFHSLGTISRVINGSSYNYNLYESEDLIDSTNVKYLTIS